jgi:hypothetical protein
VVAIVRLELIHRIDDARVNISHRAFTEQRTRKGPEIKLPLEVTLEELFNGKVLEVGFLSFYCA